eukprot:1427140-Pyramimonas_sp.AAC.2
MYSPFGKAAEATRSFIEQSASASLASSRVKGPSREISTSMPRPLSAQDNASARQALWYG